MRFVLLPGLDGTGTLFAPFAAALGAAEVIAYPPDREHTVDELVGHVTAALPHEPFVLVAESFSGPIALQVAARRPAGLRGLVLVATFARSPIPGGALLAALVGPWLFWIRPPGLALRLLLVGLRAPDGLVGAVSEAIGRVQPGVLAARLRAVLRTDSGGAARGCAVPVLYLRASADRLVPGRAGEHLRGLLPGMEIRALDGPHLLLQADPEGAARVVRAFAAGLEPPT